MKILISTYKYVWDRDWNMLRVADGVYRLQVPLAQAAEPHGHTVSAFHFDEAILKHGREKARTQLWEYIEREKPDVCIVGFSENDWGMELFKKMKTQTHTTFVYIADDDTWRWERFARHVAPYFHWVVTYDSRAIKKYHSIGITNVVHHQPGVDLEEFRKLPDRKKDIDISFVGLWSKPRERVVNHLRNAGVDVFVRGTGWPEGPLKTHAELIDVINRSKISLTLIPASFYFGWRPIVRLFLRRRDLGEGGLPYKLDIQNFYDNWRSWMMKRNAWVKARNFEAPACGTMEITQDADDLRDYYKLGEEIVVYKDLDDMVAKVKYYLTHDEEREAIARRGYERTVRDHSQVRRYEDIFRMIGKPL
jgi:spore maturation protein CgeB